MEITTRLHFRDNTILSSHLLVGKTDSPCLSISIISYDQQEVFGLERVETANIINIKNIRDCILDDVSDDIYTHHSFTKEMLFSVIDYICETYPYIKRFKLNDKSYIPCDENDTVDLLTYSIALYGKTWYESTWNATQKPSHYIQYRKEVDHYTQKETKDSYTWDIFTAKFLDSATPYAHSMFSTQNDVYRKLYESSDTFPEFFRKLAKTIDRDKKCMFFKHWLELFIYSQIHIDREWFFDMPPKHGGRRCSTRKKQKQKKRLSQICL